MSSFFSSDLSRGHRISSPVHHLEWTESKPFTGLIGPRHMTTTRAVAHQTWWPDTSPAFCNLAKAFKNNTTYFAITFQKTSKQQQQRFIIVVV